MSIILFHSFYMTAMELFTSMIVSRYPMKKNLLYPVPFTTVREVYFLDFKRGCCNIFILVIMFYNLFQGIYKHNLYFLGLDFTVEKSAHWYILRLLLIILLLNCNP